MSKAGHVYYVSSDHRISGTNENFQVHLQGRHSENKELAIQVKQVVIPNTYYLITSSNNTFVLDDGADKTVTITPGNYASMSTLATELKTQMDSATILTWTVSVDTNTNKLTFSTSQDFDMTIPTESLADVLGFTSGTNYVSSSNSLTSVDCCNILGTQFIDIISSINTDCSVSNGNHENQMLARIPVKLINPFDLVVHENSTGELVSHGDKSMNNLRLQLRNQYGEQMSLNGKVWSISFLVHED